MLAQGTTHQIQADDEAEAEGAQATSSGCAVAIRMDLRQEILAELSPELRREQPHQQRQQGSHGRPSITPRRASASLAACFNRRASAASARRPAAVRP